MYLFNFNLTIIHIIDKKNKRTKLTYMQQHSIYSRKKRKERDSHYENQRVIERKSNKTDNTLNKTKNDGKTIIFTIT